MERDRRLIVDNRRHTLRVISDHPVQSLSETVQTRAEKVHRSIRHPILRANTFPASFARYYSRTIGSPLLPIRLSRHPQLLDDLSSPFAESQQDDDHRADTEA